VDPQQLANSACFLAGWEPVRAAQYHGPGGGIPALQPPEPAHVPQPSGPALPSGRKFRLINQKGAHEKCDEPHKSEEQKLIDRSGATFKNFFVYFINVKGMEKLGLPKITTDILDKIF
jgi:hypothetical protein